VVVVELTLLKKVVTAAAVVVQTFKALVGWELLVKVITVEPPQMLVAYTVAVVAVALVLLELTVQEQLLLVMVETVLLQALLVHQ
jgi:hypothetical protein